MKKEKILCILMTAAVLLSTACGKTEDGSGTAASEPLVEKVERNPDTEGESAVGETSSAQGGASATDTGESREKAEAGIDAETAAIKEKFGENCIVQQTFEVELSEYEGKVYFVPFAPSKDGQGFHMQIVRDGEALNDIEGYVPDKLIGKSFDSLDAVSFFDINYDGDTDIILIETYGGVSFAAVYYGHSEGGYLSDRASFFPREELSENLSAQVEEMSVSGIRSFLSGGKRNGEFTDYRKAYEAVMKFSALENEERGYDLIYFDEDDIPELTAGVIGYNVSLYTYDAGTVYKVMDEWSYGAMGNSGYAYSPGQNSLRNYNTDFAGAVLYTTYMRMGAQHSLENVAQIVTYNFDDANQNGMPDENEMGSMGNYSVSYIDEREVSPEECESYDIGGYQYMETDKGVEEVKELLYT